MLIGREKEIAAIDDLVADPRGRALALLGEPGVGKTALLEAAARRPDAGTVLRAGGVESEAQLPFAGLLDLVRPVLHLGDALPAPQQAALAGPSRSARPTPATASPSASPSPSCSPAPERRSATSSSSTTCPGWTRPRARPSSTSPAASPPASPC